MGLSGYLSSAASLSSAVSLASTPLFWLSMRKAKEEKARIVVDCEMRMLRVSLVPEVLWRGETGGGVTEVERSGR